MDPTKFSRFYKMGSLEGNMIFESPTELPRELMLEMTLDAFGFDMDLVEVHSPFYVQYLLDVCMNVLSCMSTAYFVVIFFLSDRNGR